MITAFARAPWVRLSRAPRTWIVVGAWTLFIVALALTVRRSGMAHAADRILLEAYGPVALPLLAYGLVGAIVGARSLSSAVAPVKAFGADPTRATAGAVAVAMMTCAVVCGLLAAAADATAHGAPLSGGALKDALASAYGGALGGAAYAAWFALGSTFGRRGGGRFVFLVGDWALGSSDGFAALVTPRGHLRNLLGGAPPMELSERASAALLLALAVFCAVGATLRVRR